MLAEANLLRALTGALAFGFLHDSRPGLMDALLEMSEGGVAPFCLGYIGSDYSVQPDGSIDDRAVKGAVDEFANEVNRQIQVTYDDGSLAHFWFSYFIRK
eukprot:4803469-Pyramimonas_sp.AAC.3